MMNRITTDELKAASESPDPGFILDVRSDREYASGHVSGSTNIPHTALAARIDEVPKGDRVYVHCQMGGRAQFAAQVLEANGYDVYCVVPGGMGEWNAKGYPTE